MKPSTWLCLWLLLIAAFWLGCEPASFPQPPAQERSQIRFFNALNAPPVNVQLRTYGETRFLTDRLMPRTSWPEGGYTSLLSRFNEFDTTAAVDIVQIDIEDYEGDTLLIEGYRENLPKGSFSTFFLVDSLGKPILTKIGDDFEKPRGARATYRFINLYPFFSSMDVRSSNAADSLNFSFNTLEFLGYSGFQEVDAGRRTLTAYNTRSQTAVDSVSQVSLEAGGVYVFFVLSLNGFPVMDYERIN